MEEFGLYKKKVLQREDKSFIGEIDLPIRSLCQTLNKKEKIVTLSSCSGRVCLLEVNEDQNKKEAKWPYMTHEKTNFEEITKVLQDYKSEDFLQFRQESAILHLACETAELGEKILQLARDSGFNRAVFLTIKNHYILELICSQVLSIPVFDKKILITEEYLKYLCTLANKKQEQSWRVIENFEKRIEETL